MGIEDNLIQGVYTNTFVKVTISIDARSRVLTAITMCTFWTQNGQVLARCQMFRGSWVNAECVHSLS